MKTSFKLMALFILTLPVFAHASDGAEALQRFNERNKAMFEQQAKDIEKRKQAELQKAEQEKKTMPDALRAEDQQTQQ